MKREKDKYRLVAFLHDPVYKPYVLLRRAGHEREAAKIISRILSIHPDDAKKMIEEIRHTDIFASTTDRAIIPENAPDILRDEQLEFRHPVCGTRIKLPPYNGDLKHLRETIIDALKNKKYSSYRDVLETLWHELLPYLEEKIKDIPWRLLPADTRVPDHSIWQHLKVSADVNPFEGEYIAWLCIFSISPVQRFIRQARKTMDLWAGSYILSRLTFQSMKRVIDAHGSVSIIYPDMQNHPWLIQSGDGSEYIPSIPNKFVALIPESDKEEVRKLCIDVEDAYNETIEQWISDVEKKFKISIPDEHVKRALSPVWIALGIPLEMERTYSILKELLSHEHQEQIEDFIDIFVHGELKYGTKSSGYFYGFIYTAAEKALAARKTLRDGLRAPSEEGRERCHVCGERNAIVRHNRKNSRIEYLVDGKWERGELTAPRHLKEGEYLCGMCLLKRVLPDIMNFRDFRFPSTADVAAANIIYRSHPQNWKGLSSEILTSPSIPYLSEKLGADTKIPEGRVLLEIASGNIREFDRKDVDIIQGVIDRIREEKKRSPNPYYALISMDGDELGKWLAGQKGIELSEETNVYNSHVWKEMDDEFRKKMRKLYNRNRRPVTPSYHASISTALQNFSLHMVPLIVEGQHLGKLIYAGGDDVLAMVNLEHLWNVMQLLRAAYSGMVKFDRMMNGKWRILLDRKNSEGVVKKGNMHLITMGPCATLSAGVVIAHYKTPLSIVISRAFQLMKVAKEEYGRDAFVVEWIKHSGETVKAGSKWKMLDELDAIDRLKQLSEIFHPEADVHMTRGFVRFLRQVGRRIDYEEYLMGPLFKLAMDRYIQKNPSLRGEDAERRERELKEKFSKVIGGFDIEELLNFLDIILLMKGRYGNA